MRLSTFLELLFLVELVESAPLDLETLTDQYLFQTSIEDFLEARGKGSDREGLDWTADGCSSSPDSPMGFDFHNACLRHDFGYRNYKLQGRCGKSMKKRIDKNFQKDMYNECAKEEFETMQEQCEIVADGYYFAVHLFGKKHFCARL